MSPLCLLLLSLFPLLLALPSPPVLRQTPPELKCEGGNRNCVQKVFLKNGFATVDVSAFFNLSGTDPSKATEPAYEVMEGNRDNIITNVQFSTPTPPDSDHQNVVYSARVFFRGFPGRSSLRIYIKDSNGKTHSITEIFETVGLVLYEALGDKIQTLTGLNPNRTRLQVLEGGVLGKTVNVSIFEGDPISTPPGRQHIRFVVEDKYSDILPWNENDCPVIDEPAKLGSLCSMAFAPDFKTFSIRVSPDKELPSEIRVDFDWVGIREYQARLVGEVGISGAAQPISLTSDVITSIIVNQTRDSTKSTDAAPLAGWKIGVIAITSVLLAFAAVTLVCCFFCSKKRSPKKPEPDVVGFKDKFQEIGFLRRSTLRRGEDDGDDDQCYVEEPPTPDDSEILMLENESRGHRRSAESHQGHIEGLIPMDRLNEDKSVERLVLPPGVVRGVELESSTEGASGFGYPSRPREIEGETLGENRTSLPHDQFTKPREYRTSRDRSSPGSRRSGTERSRDPDYFRDSHERIRSLERDRARIREIDREIERERSARERSEERMRPQSLAEAFPESGPIIDERTNEMTSRSRGGVGAAINRIRQLDLLNGPASRGLVGRNGEPIRNPQGDGRSNGSLADISGSALS